MIPATLMATLTLALASGKQAEQPEEPLHLGVVLYPGFELLDVFEPVVAAQERLGGRSVKAAVGQPVLEAGSQLDRGDDVGPAAGAERQEHWEETRKSGQVHTDGGRRLRGPR